MKWFKRVAIICWSKDSSGLYANLVPIFITILSVLLLNEALQSFHLVSLAMVFCGIYIFEIKAQRKNIN